MSGFLTFNSPFDYLVIGYFIVVIPIFIKVVIINKWMNGSKHKPEATEERDEAEKSELSESIQQSIEAFRVLDTVQSVQKDLANRLDRIKSKETLLETKQPSLETLEEFARIVQQLEDADAVMKVDVEPKENQASK